MCWGFRCELTSRALRSSPRCPQAYEKQRGARREERKELQRAAAQDQVRGFLEKEAAIVSRPLNPFTPKAASGTGPGEGGQTCGGWGSPGPGTYPRHRNGTPLPPVDDAQAGPSAAGPAGKDKDKDKDKDKMLPSFWIPSLTPEAKATKLEKPVSAPCPQAPLRPLCQRLPGTVPGTPSSRTWPSPVSLLL